MDDKLSLFSSCYLGRNGSQAGYENPKITSKQNTHLNINSVQNKFEELNGIIKTIRAHIMFVSETKIDASYPNAQFTIPGYSLYRNDRKKGGGGIMALISTSLIKTRLTPDKNFKTLETIAFQVKTETGNMVIIGIYRPPRALCGEYQLLLES